MINDDYLENVQIQVRFRCGVQGIENTLRPLSKQFNYIASPHEDTQIILCPCFAYCLTKCPHKEHEIACLCVLKVVPLLYIIAGPANEIDNGFEAPRNKSLYVSLSFMPCSPLGSWSKQVIYAFCSACVVFHFVAVETLAGFGGWSVSLQSTASICNDIISRMANIS